MPEEKTHNVKTRYVKPRAYSLNRSPATVLGGCNTGLTPGITACTQGPSFGVSDCVTGTKFSGAQCQTGNYAHVCHTGDFAI